MWTPKRVFKKFNKNEEVNANVRKVGFFAFLQPAFGEILLNLRRYLGNSKTKWEKITTE